MPLTTGFVKLSRRIFCLLVPAPASQPTLRTILVLSDDRSLANQIGDCLGIGERVMRLPLVRESLDLPGDLHELIVVRDCRGGNRESTESALISLRRTNPRRFRLVALTDAKLEFRLEVVGRDAVQDLDVVLAAHDHVGHTLRALLNDVDGTVGIAISLECLRQVLEDQAMRLAEVVLGSACRVDGVGRAATALGTGRVSLGTGLAGEGLQPKEVIRVARATYAAVLAARSNLTLGQIAVRINVSAGRYVQELLESEFGMRAAEIETAAYGQQIDGLIDRLLTEWSWRHGRGGGGG